MSKSQDRRIALQREGASMTTDKIVTYFDHEYMLGQGAWCAHLDGYDGEPDAGFQPVAHAKTEAEAIEALLDMLE